jgi:hypothetical protein
MTKDYLVENLRGMCAFTEPHGRCDQCRELRNFCTPCYAAAEIEHLRSELLSQQRRDNPVENCAVDPVVRVGTEAATRDANSSSNLPVGASASAVSPPPERDHVHSACDVCGEEWPAVSPDDRCDNCGGTAAEHPCESGSLRCRVFVVRVGRQPSTADRDERDRRPRSDEKRTS